MVIAHLHVYLSKVFAVLQSGNHNKNLHVQNLIRTGDRECKECKTWIEHWRKFTSSDRQTCCVNGRS